MTMTNSRSAPTPASASQGSAGTAAQGPYRVVSVGDSTRTVLTGPEHAALDDATLLEVALDQARRIGLTVSREALRIHWAPAFCASRPENDRSG